MNGIGEGIGRMLFGLLGLCLIMAPLAIWKLWRSFFGFGRTCISKHNRPLSQKG